MPTSLCPLSYDFQDLENFYIFLNGIDLLQGILGFIFYYICIESFSSGLLMVWYQIFFCLSASTIFSYYKNKKTFLTYPHLCYFVFKTISLFVYFIIFVVNIIELDFNYEDSKNAAVVSLLILAFIFNIFQFSWHFKMLKNWFKSYKVKTSSYSPQDTKSENLIINEDSV